MSSLHVGNKLHSFVQFLFRNGTNVLLEGTELVALMYLMIRSVPISPSEIRLLSEG